VSSPLLRYKPHLFMITDFSALNASHFFSFQGLIVNGFFLDCDEAEQLAELTGKQWFNLESCLRLKKILGYARATSSLGKSKKCYNLLLILIYIILCFRVVCTRHTRSSSGSSNDKLYYGSVGTEPTVQVSGTRILPWLRQRHSRCVQTAF
jgi:hypothetical protein